MQLSGVRGRFLEEHRDNGACHSKCFFFPFLCVWRGTLKCFLARMPYKVLQWASSFKLPQSSTYFPQCEEGQGFLFLQPSQAPLPKLKYKEKSINECRGNTEVQHALIKIQLRVYSWYRYLSSHVCTDHRLLKIVGGGATRHKCFTGSLYAQQCEVLGWRKLVRKG